ncbi:MAG: polyprenyl diphosphate synthase [Desulfovibrionaceae bacterium]|nr:polyprenyl diphosphate synthase [Desulfovibrionaceae bacterium]
MTSSSLMSKLPRHIAVIMDGNGRWAKQRGLSRSEGHRAGVQAARSIVKECLRLGIPYLTLYTFSTENWGRPQEEVSLLFKLLTDFLHDEEEDMCRNGIRLNIFGDPDQLPFSARSILRRVMKSTSANSKLTVNLALNYSGREEILRAVRSILRQGYSPDDLTEAIFQKELYSGDIPDPDLIIRTSGEQRISNFLLFQCAYSEFYFTPVYWPDFSPESLQNALNDYANRSRRYGLTEEQNS